MTPEFRKAIGIVFLVLAGVFFLGQMWMTRQYASRIKEKYPDLKKRMHKLKTKELPDDEPLRNFHRLMRRAKWISEALFIAGIFLTNWHSWFF